MRFSPHLLDEIRARLPVSQVVSKHVRLKRAGREFIGLSPFKHEKTPSFTVNDQKGFYHCFATGEHGDIFRFLMKVEGIGFAEAVEQCAAEAGVDLPKPNETERRQEDRQNRLREVVEASCRYFEELLSTPAGQAGRSYLQRRGLDDEAIRRFRLGYAPASRDGLKRHLLGLGYSLDELVTSGMCIGGPDIAVPYDRFRDRVMFPIEDMKGHVIAFGGRALAADQKAKYLNSPETPLFHKGHLLYNMAKARRSAFDHNTVVVVEGYMDVIACSEAGFRYTVAPLGTALTEDQLKLLWRMAKEPVLCFDGDAAGRKAAARAIDIALPLIVPGQSVRFAFLPDGPDPDDLIRNEGPAAFKTVLEAAQPLVDVLWHRELSREAVDTPERRAAFEGRINAETGKILNENVRGHYQKEIRSRLWELWKGSNRPRAGAGNDAQRPQMFGVAQGGGGRNRRGSGWRDAPAPRTESLQQSAVVRSAKGGVSPSETLLLRAMLTHPWLLEDHGEEFSELTFSRREFTELRDAILGAQVSVTGENGLDSEELHVHLMEGGFGDLLAQFGSTRTYFPRWARRADSDPDAVEENWRHSVGLYRAEHELQTELNGAKRDLCEEISDENFARLRNLNTHYQYSEFKNAGSGGVDDTDSLNEFLASKLKEHGLKHKDR